MIYVRVPATSANMGSGFDSLGIALGIYNTLKISEIEKDGGYSEMAFFIGGAEGLPQNIKDGANFKLSLMLLNIII